jgi:phage FluMu protein Com
MEGTTMTMQIYRFTLRCPGCNKVVLHAAAETPDMNCGDCLMDRVEVETFQVTDKKLLYKIDPTKVK